MSTWTERWSPVEEVDDWVRIHYSDPATEFDCGWHQDDEHFQRRDGDEAPTRKPVRFSHETSVGILWECLDRLETVLDER